MKRGLEIDKDNVDLKIELAKCYHLKKQYEDAVKLYDELLVKNPNDREVKYNKALALHAQGKFKEAIDIYTALYAEKQEPNIKDYLSKAYVSAGKSLEASSNYRKAIANYEKALELDVNDTSAYVNMANAYDKLGSGSKAIECYEKAIEIDPDNKAVSAAYAKLLIKYKKTDDANKIAENIVTSKEVSNADKVITLIALGEQYYDSKDYEKAKVEFEKAVAIDSDNPSLLIKTGNCYKQQNQNEKALEYYKKALRL